MSKLKSEDSGLTSGYTLLMLKAEEGNVNEVHRMITELKNTDINASNKRGYTSLAIAVKAGHFDVVKLLLLSGSNPNAKNNSGQSPLFLACWNNYEQIVRLLLDSGAEINAVDHRGWTPLMISAYHGHKQILRELLARDADTSIQDLFGKKAIDRAKDAEVVKILQDSEHIDDNNAQNRPYNIITNPVIHNPKENLSLQYSPIPYTTVPVEKKVDKNYQPPSILKKSNSKTSVGIGRTTMDRNQSFVSPQTPQGGSLSAHKSHSVSSTHRKTVGNLQRPSTQAKALNNSRKEPQSAGKNTPMLRSFLQDTTSPKSTISTKRVPGSPTGGDLQRQAFKEDMERLLQDQMGFMCERVQQVVENKIALEVPMQMQDYENQFKEQVESILRFKAADIFRNLQNIFGLKLKFCLSRLGYDTRYLEQATSLESETSFNPETIRFIQEPPKRYNEKEFKGIENEINKVEKTILSHKVPQQSSTFRKSQPESPRYGEHQCDHTSQLHRSEIRNDLLDQMGHEMRATTEYLLDFSKSKVGELTREESGILYKKIVAEVTDNMESLETELKTKFEEVIAEKLNRVVDYLGRASQNGNSIDFKSLEKTDQSTHKIIRSSFYNTSEQDYQTSDAREERLEDNATQEALRKGSQYSEMQKANDNALRAQQEASQAKEKIQRIKNSLNFMDDEEGEPKSERFRQSRSNFKGDIRNERASKVEVPVEEESANFSVPVKTEEGSYEEPERIYNPTYRSTSKTETTQQLSNREYWTQPESRGTNVPAKGVAKSGRSTQSRGTDSKSGAKQVIPGHRFAFNDSKEQELIKCYDFSHE